MPLASQPLAARAEALAVAGNVADAYRLLTSAEAERDSAALLTLARWRLTGDLIRRDLEEARRLFGKAAELGDAQAEAIYTAMLANGAGSNRRWTDALQRLRKRSARQPEARRQLDLIKSMNLDPDGEPTRLPEARVLSSAPRIATAEAFLTPAECKYLIDRALPLLQDAVVVHPQTGALVRDPVRTSRSAAFPFVREDPAIHAINRRIAALTGTSYEQGEPLQVLSYEPGQEYKLHSDALPPGPNQRVMTFLVYLNEEYQGGETEFPEVGVSYRGRSGDALLFVNADETGQLDPRTRHAGRPVTAGRKMLLSKWIREKPLDLSGPPGRPF